MKKNDVTIQRNACYIYTISPLNTWSFSSPVDESSSHATLEETAAAVAGIDAIVFTTAPIGTHFTKQAIARCFTWD